MNLSTCTKYFQDMGLDVRGRVAFGIYHEYPLFLQFQGPRETVGSVLIRFYLQTPLDKKQRKECKLLLKKRCHLVFTGQTIQLTIRTPQDVSLVECKRILNIITDHFNTKNYKAPARCPICGQDQCDSTVFYNGSYQKAHASCINAAMEHITQKTENNKMNGSYPLGILGAVLGGLVGILPNLLTILLTETIYVLLYALIPICIYWGYRLLRGVMNKTAIILTIGLSILYLFIMEFLLLVIGVYLDTNGLLLIKECWDAFTDPTLFKEILSGMTSSFIFLALGIFYCWRMISESNVNIHSNVEFTLSTLIPIVKPVPVAETVSDAMETDVQTPESASETPTDDSAAIS